MSISTLTTSCNNQQYNDIQASVDLVCANAGTVSSNVECHERIRNSLICHLIDFTTNLECRKKNTTTKEPKALNSYMGHPY